MKNIIKLITFISLLCVLFSTTIYARGKGSAKSSKELTTTTIETTTLETTETTTWETTETTTWEITETTTYADVISAVVGNSPANDKIPFMPSERTNTTENEDFILTQFETLFENGDFYWIKRYNFKKDSQTPYITSFNIPGDTIEIRYIDPETKQWVMTTNLENIKKNTLFITTDKYNIVVSVPALYKNEFKSHTLQVLKDEELPVQITKLDGEYNLKFTFKQSTENIAELWALQSSNTLVDFSLASSFDNLKVHDLGIERRWSFDGYYFPIPSNYDPTGIDMIYRHPANYTGASWARYGENLLAKDFGYVMTNVCMKNQNESGYWYTGPKSLWLESDFNIKEEFYDTRFNTDFATSLVYAYKNYNNKEFLTAAVKYAEFFITHAENNHYDANNGGWLVEDYSSPNEYTRTHVSLNHQLAEMNFLYELYNVTNEKRYLELADLMLLGIENTKDMWVLANNNLNYAIMYTGVNNKMVDYPYLTYNDLYQTKSILNSYFNKTSETIEYLMACKKEWMDNNGITEYMK